MSYNNFYVQCVNHPAFRQLAARKMEKILGDNWYNHDKELWMNRPDEHVICNRDEIIITFENAILARAHRCAPVSIDSLYNFNPNRQEL